MPASKDYTGASGRTWVVTTVAALALAAIACLAFAPNPARASDIQGIQDGTYMLLANGQPNCTVQAVVLDDSIVLLTANHCVTDQKAVYSVSRVAFDETEFGRKLTEEVFFLDVARRDSETDVAILLPRDQTISLAAVDLASPAEAKAMLKGQGVLVAGYPGTNMAPMGDLVFTQGMYVGLSLSYEPSIKTPLYRTTASVHPGNSGGGLYIEVGDTWKLIGITSQTDPSRMWVGSLFAPRDAIEKNIRLSPKPATDK